MPDPAMISDSLHLSISPSLHPSPPLPLSPSPPRRTASEVLRIGSWPFAATVCVSVWLMMRIVFFAGIQGSDDLYHMRYAALWDRAPINHWESRLVANALMAGAMQLFGPTALAGALPSLLASLAVMGCVLVFCHRYLDARHAWWAGLLAAVLPLEVHVATTPSAYGLMTGFMTVGTLAYLEAPASRRARWLAAAALALGAMVHLAGVYYVAALTLTALAFDRRAYLRPMATVFAVSAAVFAVDMAMFHFAFGDAFGRFRLALVQAPTENSDVPLHVGERFNWEFAIWPVRQLLFSKSFGVAMCVAMGWGLWNRRRLSRPMRLLLATSVVFWVWMSFGSQVPWAYRPFWRMLRFLLPLTLPMTVLFAAAVARARHRRAAIAGGVAVIAVCAVNLAASGSWGQSAVISGELLEYARHHPQLRFVTDFRTLNEMYVLNGMKQPGNVVAAACRRSELLDPALPRIRRAEMRPDDHLLENPLNTERVPPFAALVNAHGGELEYGSQTSHRLICRLIPPLQRFDWSVRKPPGRVLTIRSEKVSG